MTRRDLNALVAELEDVIQNAQEKVAPIIALHRFGRITGPDAHARLAPWQKLVDAAYEQLDRLSEIERSGAVAA